MRIITGATGTAHVTSNDDGEFNLGLWGNGLVVLPNGGKLAATVTDNNTITISDGDLIFQGRHALINPGATEALNISTGAVDTKRKDLIVARYEFNTMTGIESLTLEVIEGKEVAGEATDPAYTTGDIRSGSVIAEVPLYRVNIVGINIASVDALFKPVSSLYELTERVKDYVPKTRKVNGKALSGDITLSASDVSALPSNTTHVSGDVPTSRKVNGKALTGDITLTASDLGTLKIVVTADSSTPPSDTSVLWIYPS